MARRTLAVIEAENTALRMELATLRQQMQDMASVASAINTLPRVQATVSSMPEWQRARAEAMAAAKEIALRTRKTVKA